MTYLHKALDIRTELNDENGVALIINRIGVIHSLQDDYDKALDFFNKAFELRKKMHDEKTGYMVDKLRSIDRRS